MRCEASAYSLAITLALTIFLAPPAKADFAKGWAAYERGDIATAVREFTAGASQGEALSQYNLAVLYRDGEGVPKSLEKAASLFQQAAKAGMREAMHNLCVLYRDGTGVTKDLKIAFEYCRDAAERGLSQAQALLGAMCYYGEGVAKNNAEAKTWLRRAAKQGEFNAMVAFANIVGSSGQYDKSDMEEAYRWLEIATRNLQDEKMRDEAEDYQSEWIGTFVDSGRKANAIAAAKTWKPVLEPDPGAEPQTAASSAVTTPGLREGQRLEGYGPLPFGIMFADALNKLKKKSSDAKGCELNLRQGRCLEYVERKDGREWVTTVLFENDRMTLVRIEVQPIGGGQYFSSKQCWDAATHIALEYSGSYGLPDGGLPIKPEELLGTGDTPGDPHNLVVGEAIFTFPRGGAITVSGLDTPGTNKCTVVVWFES